jgi:regulator of RNase E activity RraA
VLAVNGSRRIAPWGELLSTAATARGAAGCVTDGLVRDVKGIREIGFPTFCGGFGPLDSKGRGEMVAVDVLVEIGGVPVAPGDLVFGDLDGVVVIPQAVEADVLDFAFSKVEAEETTRAELRAGAPLADVFRRHGIL